MNALLRELLADLKAATLIGAPESVQAVLDEVRAASEDALPPSAIQPLGEALARLPIHELLPLLEDEDALLRAAAAVAAARRRLNGDDVPTDALLFAADDSSPEVRAALGSVLSERPELAAPLAADWLNNPSMNVQQTGLAVLCRLPDPPSQILQLIQPFDSAEDHDFRSDLVDAVSAAAGNGAAAEVLALLELWAARPEPNVWVITRALSASWALDHSPTALHVLDRLAQTLGEVRSIQRARARHTA